MNPINACLSVFTLAVALLSTNTLGEPPNVGSSAGKPSAQKKIAFHVIGLAKTKSGAT